LKRKSGHEYEEDWHQDEQIGGKPPVSDSGGAFLLCRKHQFSSTQLSDVSSIQNKTVDLLTSRTGGAYLFSAKLRMMQAQIAVRLSDKESRLLGCGAV
jgi:hypothetical protein